MHSANGRDSEDAVSRSEERFRNLVESTSDWFWEVDQSCTYTYVGPRIRELLGYEPEEVLGKTPFDLMPEGEAKDICETFTAIMDERRRFTLLENTLVHKDGHFVVVETSGVPIMDDEGTLRGYRGTDRDITERKKAEMALRESESRYRSLVETMNEGFATADENYVFTYVNHRFTQMLGYESDEMVGHGMVEFLDEANQTIAGAQSAERRVGRHDHYELAWTARDDHKVYTLISPKPVFGPDGQFLGSFATLTDITDRKYAEDALRESEEKFRQLFQSANDAIFVSELNADDAPGKFIEVNDIACRRLGYSRDELLSMTPLDIDAPEFLSGVPAIVTEIVKQGHATFEMTHTTKDGLMIPVEVSSHLFNVEGRRTILSIARDITERKQVEETLRESEERFRNLFESAADEFFLHDLEGRFVQVNDSACRKLGYSCQELLQLRVSDIVVGYTETDLDELWRDLMIAGPVTVQTTHRRKDGSTMPVEGRLSPFDYRGQRLVLAVVRDTTERKQAEENLRRRGRQLETLASTSRRLNRVLDVPTVLRELVASAIELCDAEACAAGLFIDGKMVFTEYNRQGELIPIHYEFGAGYGVPGWVIETRACYVSNDAKNDPYVVPEIQQALGFYNLANIPIISRSGELLGCFETHNTWGGRPFDDADISMLRGLAASASVALENARMLADRERAEEERREFEKSVEEQKRIFYRETIFSVTDGKLDICEDCDVACYLARPDIAVEVSEAAQLADARHKVEDFCRLNGLTKDTIGSFIIGVGEAITNAVKHGTKGKLYAGVRDGSLWVAVEDNGPGIGSLILPRAVLLRGYSTKPSLGLGYSVMLDVADRIHLKTNERGTLVILEKALTEGKSEFSLDDLPDTWENLQI